MSRPLAKYVARSARTLVTITLVCQPVCASAAIAQGQSGNVRGAPAQSSGALDSTVAGSAGGKSPFVEKASPWSFLVGENSSWFWTMMSFFGLIVSLGFIYRQLRAQVTGNMMQALLAMGDKWDSDHIMAFRCAACERYEATDLNLGGVDGEALAFLEDIGLYLRKRVFDIDIVWERYSYFVEHYWCMYRVQVMAHRSAKKDGSWFSNFEYLYDLVAEYSRTKYGLDPIKDAAEIKMFAEGEIQTFAVHKGRTIKDALIGNTAPAASVAITS